MTAAPKRRTRLAPEDRRNAILDQAAGLVIDQGLSGLTMEGVAARAEVSPALLYHYFPSRLDLLQAVLRREYERLHAAQAIENMASSSFEDMVRRMTALSLLQSEERGLLIERLMSDPGVVAAFEVENRADRRAAVRFLSRRLARAHDIVEAEAEAIVELCMGITAAAGARIAAGTATRVKIEPLTIGMILGAISAGVAEIKRR